MVFSYSQALLDTEQRQLQIIKEHITLFVSEPNGPWKEFANMRRWYAPSPPEIANVFYKGDNPLLRNSLILRCTAPYHLFLKEQVLSELSELSDVFAPEEVLPCFDLQEQQKGLEISLRNPESSFRNIETQVVPYFAESSSLQLMTTLDASVLQTLTPRVRAKFDLAVHFGEEYDGLEREHGPKRARRLLGYRMV